MQNATAKQPLDSRENGVKEARCPRCRTLLFKGVFQGWIEAFCRKCKRSLKFVLPGGF